MIDSVIIAATYTFANAGVRSMHENSGMDSLRHPSHGEVVPVAAAVWEKAHHKVGYDFRIAAALAAIQGYLFPSD